MTTKHSDIHFAEEAGKRIQKTFALCEFASELVGKASEEKPSIDPRSTSEESIMTKRIDRALTEKLRQESEKTKEDAYPKGARGSRPSRTKVQYVRPSEQGEEQTQ